MSRKMVQVNLKQGSRLKTTWIDKDPRVKIRSKISLKDVDGIWEVMMVYPNELDIDQLDSQRNFDNNNYDKHKGLGL